MTDHNLEPNTTDQQVNGIPTDDIDTLISRSSLGSPGARAVRAHVTPGRIDTLISRRLTRQMYSETSTVDRRGPGNDEHPSDREPTAWISTENGGSR